MASITELLKFINDKTIVIVDERIIDIKPKVAKSLGYSNTEMLTNRPYTDLILSPMQTWQDLSITTLGFRQEDGSVENISTDIMIYVEGSTRYCILRLTNLTYHSNSVSQIEQLEAKFNAILSHSPFHILVVDKQDQLSFINQVGDYYRGKDLTKVPLTSLLQPEYEDTFKKTIHLTRKTKSYRKLLIQGKSKGWYRMHMVPLLLDEDNDVMILGEDVTDQIKYQEELQLSKDDYRSLIQNLPSPLTMVDMDGNFLEVNEMMEKLLGYTRAELLEKKNTDIVHTDHYYKTEHTTNYLLENNLMTDIGNLVRADGDIVTVEYNAMNTTYQDKQVRIAVLKDITADIKLRQQREDLLSKIAHDQRVESLGVLVGGIAHDFNNYLSAILSNTEIIQLLLEEQVLDPKQLDKEMRQITNITKNAARLTNQLLAYAGKAEFKMEVLNLNEEIKNLSRLFKLSLHSNIEIIYELSEEIDLIKADVTQLQQFLMNLLTNANEALVKSQNAKIIIRTDRRGLEDDNIIQDYTNNSHGSYAVIEVEDNGPGIDEETVSRMFDPFYSTKGTGRGLGLSIVLGFVKGHHGALALETAQDQGSKFSLYLPIIEVNSTIHGHENVEIDQSRSDPVGNVIIGDDNPVILDNFTKLIQKLGYKTYVAKNGLEVLQAIQELDDIEFILVDITMPKLDGISTTKKIREIIPDLPIILMSGYTEVYNLVEDIVNQPRTEFLQKPFQLDHLKKTIESIQK